MFIPLILIQTIHQDVPKNNRISWVLHAVVKKSVRQVHFIVNTQLFCLFLFRKYVDLFSLLGQWHKLSWFVCETNCFSFCSCWQAFWLLTFSNWSIWQYNNLNIFILFACNTTVLLLLYLCLRLLLLMWLLVLPKPLATFISSFILFDEISNYIRNVTTIPVRWIYQTCYFTIKKITLFSTFFS